MADEEVHGEAQLLDGHLGVQAGVRMEALVPRRRRVEERQALGPGEQLVLELHEEQHRDGDGLGGPLDPCPVSNRFLTICYLALVDFDKIELKPTQFMETAEWLAVDKRKILRWITVRYLKMRWKHCLRNFLIRQSPRTCCHQNLHCPTSIP